MASPRLEETPEPPSLHVHRLESGPSDQESVVMVKLTDEIYSALMKAQRKGLKLRVHVDNKGGRWDLGDCGIFHFQSQRQSNDTDTICSDPRRGNSQRTTGVFHTKYQIQATDKSFAETREKAQKLVEEEKSRGVKDANKMRNGKLPGSSGFSRGPSSITSRNGSPMLSRPGASSEALNRISPNKFSNSTGTNGSSSSTSNGSGRPVSHPLAAELRRKKLRARVIHLIVTGKFSSSEEIATQLRKDGLNPGDETDLNRRVEQFLHETAERNSSRRFVLKSSFYSEVDARWAWFTQDEKSAVRKLLGSSMQNMNSTSFAPMRKSGMERMQAPSQPTLAAQNVSPESIPTPPTSRPPSATKKSTSPLLQTRISPNPTLTPVHDVVSEDMQSGVKRKAHVPSSSVISDKRLRQDSASPPEDPTSRTPTQKEVRERKLAAARAGGSTSSSRLSSPCSLSSPKQPVCDYEKMFPECKTLSDAEKYFSLFHAEYPHYNECYSILSNASREFIDMENQLRNAGRHSNNFHRIERAIQERFAHYEKDEEFLKARQRHADLRAKLGVLKQRLSDWDRSQEVV